jgi:hypothetical protein
LKKLFAVLLSCTMIISIFAPAAGAQAAPNNKSGAVTQNFNENAAEAQKRNMLKTIEKYVVVQEDGTLALNDVPHGLYKKYNLEALEAHFNTINKEIKNGHLVVDEELNINPTGFSTMATYGKWTYHWWGYDRLFTNSQAKEYVKRLELQAAGAAMVTGVTAPFPPIAGLASISSGYWLLLANRVEANNKGNGVKVAVTWVNIFNVTPL